MAYFPLFVDLTNQNCLVVGGGKVAERKVRMLLEFDAAVHVIAERISDSLRGLADETTSLQLHQRRFEDADISGCFLVIAATDDEALNSHISELCKMQHIHVNVVDRGEACSFIVPAYVKQQNVVAAFSSGGKSPVVTQHLKTQAAEYVTEEIGEINEFLGSIRRKIQNSLGTEKMRKEAFAAVLEAALTNHSIPSEKEIGAIVSRVKAQHEL